MEWSRRDLLSEHHKNNLRRCDNEKNQYIETEEARPNHQSGFERELELSRAEMRSVDQEYREWSEMWSQHREKNRKHFC